MPRITGEFLLDKGADGVPYVSDLRGRAVSGDKNEIVVDPASTSLASRLVGASCPWREVS